MSWWDGFIVVLIAVALIRGYQIGLAKRFTGWVGGIFVFLILWFRFDGLSAWAYKFVDGQQLVKGPIREYLKARYSKGELDIDGLSQMLQGFPLDPRIVAEASSRLQEAGSGLENGLFDQVATILAVPGWNILLFLGAWVFLQIICGVIGQIIFKLVEQVRVLTVIDKFAGALVSALFSVILITALSAFLMLLFNVEQPLGAALHGSYFAPALQVALQLLLGSGGLL